jgi:replication factor A1
MPRLESIVQTISEKTGKSVEEINGMVNQKKDKFSGLLTEEGAAFMIARELNVELEQDRQGTLDNTVSVQDLKDGMQGINVELDVKHIFSPKSFEKNGKSGKLCSLVGGDATGETRLTVWNDDIKKLEGIEKGDTIVAKNCYVKLFQEKPQLSVSYRGDIMLKEKGTDDSVTLINDLKDSAQDVSVKGKVAQHYGIKTFEKEGKEGHITAFEIEDDSGSTRVAAWNELADPAADLKVGDSVKIEGGYTKEGQNELELHLGWRARILKL